MDIQPTIEPLSAHKARRRSPEAGNLDYTSSLRGMVYALWRGTVSLFDFMDTTSLAITRGFSRAFYEGAADCGITPSELTSTEISVLQSEINTEMLYMLNYGADIAAAGKNAGEKLRTHTLRLPMWSNRYEMMRNLGRIYACQDAKLQWTWNPLKEHCRDCAMLNGRVYRASHWRESGWVPRGRNLECGGYKCGCTLSPTSLPITPGPVPRSF